MMQATGKSPTTMRCPECSVRCKRFGKHRNGLQRYRCNYCRKTYTEEHKRPLGAMTVPMEKATLALQLLIEGTSVRSAERINEWTEIFGSERLPGAPCWSVSPTTYIPPASHKTPQEYFMKCRLAV